MNDKKPVHETCSSCTWLRYSNTRKEYRCNNRDVTMGYNPTFTMSCKNGWMQADDNDYAILKQQKKGIKNQQ